MKTLQIDDVGCEELIVTYKAIKFGWVLKNTGNNLRRLGINPVTQKSFTPEWRATTKRELVSVLVSRFGKN